MSIENKILVTGAKGMLGQDLCPIFEDEGYEVIEAGHQDLDITDYDKAKAFIEKIAPQIIVHCAGYTNVDKAEEEPELAHLVNGIGTENLAKICGEKDILMVYISTDYVFDGESEKAYTPKDKTNPLSVYGKTKLEGENAVQKYCKKFYIARTSWLYGHHGKNFVETMLSLKDNSEIKVVNDQKGCPTWTVDLSYGIMELIEENYDYGIYHVCGSGETTWYGFAHEIFNVAREKVNLKPCTTKDFPRPAHRPQNSVMENQEICRDWKSALREYIALRP